MSKQLAVSAAFSTFAMAAFVVFARPAAEMNALHGNAGANSLAPAYVQLPDAPALPLFAD